MMLITSINLQSKIKKNPLFTVYFNLLVGLSIHQTALLAGLSLINSKYYYSYEKFIFGMTPHSPLVFVFCIIVMVYVNNLWNYFGFLNQCFQEIHSQSHEKNEEDINFYRLTLRIFNGKQGLHSNEFDPFSFIDSEEFDDFIKFLKREKLESEFDSERLMNVSNALILKYHLENFIRNVESVEEREMIPIEVREPDYLLNVLKHSGFSDTNNGKEEKTQSQDFLSISKDVIKSIEKTLVKKYLDEYLLIQLPKTEKFRVSKIKYLNGDQYSELDLPYGLLSEERFLDWKNHQVCVLPDIKKHFTRNRYKSLKKSDETDLGLQHYEERKDFEMIEMV